MRRFALYAAVAAAITGTTGMTSQAAVSVYVAGGNCGGWSGGGGNVGGFGGNFFDSGSGNTGTGCSAEDIFQMVFPSDPWSDRFGGWDGDCGFTVPGTCDTPLIPDCFGTWQDSWKPECPDLWGCPGGETPDTQLPGAENPGTGSSGTQNPGVQDPGTGSSGSQNPGTGNPGTGSSGSQNPGTGNPGTGSTGTQNPGIQNPGTGSTGTQNPGNQTSGTGDQGTLLPGTGNSGTQNSGNQISGSQAADIQKVIDLVNEERAKAGLAPVTEAADVSEAAAVRARETAHNFSHTRPDGTYYTTVLDQIGVRYMGSGENIAYGQQTPAAVMSGWMNSQGHRANILDRNFTKIGVSCYENASGVKYWVQLFTY